MEDRISGALEGIDDILLSNNPFSIDQIGLFFAPSLSEFSNLRERELVDKWRKEVLTKLAQLPDEKGSKVWTLISQYIEGQFVHYETSDGGDPDKRLRRVNSVIDEKVINRFPDSDEKQDRARSFIQSKRNNFHYPSFEEMKLAYGVLV